MNYLGPLVGCLCIATYASGAAASPVIAQQARVDALFAQYDAKTPGCTVGVERHGQTLLATGYGAADLKQGRSLTPRSSVYMASVSKQVAAMAVLLLVEDGRLQLGDNVRQFIPQLPEYAAPVTVRQLLTHTSGIRDYFTLGSLNGKQEEHVYTEADVLALLNRQQSLDFEPGSDFLYSNSGYVLLSMVVQRVSGSKLDDFARKRIFTPLGMTNTRFQHDHTVPVANKANGYVRGDGGWAVANSNLNVVGDGGLYSTVQDMLRWSSNLGHSKIGARSLAMMSRTETLNDGSPTGYGMGLGLLTYRGLPVISHGGSLAGYRTQNWWFPEQQLGIVLMCNNGEARAGDLVTQVADIFLETEMAPATVLNTHASTEAPGIYAGVYRAPSGDYTEFVLRGDELVAARPNRQLVQIAPAKFVSRTNPDGIRFVFNVGTKTLEMVRSGQPTRMAERIEPVALSREAGAVYLGRYESEEASLPITVRYTTEPLLVIEGGPEWSVIASGRDRLWVPQAGFELKFTRGGTGQITGVILNAGRARGLKYRRAGSLLSEPQIMVRSKCPLSTHNRTSKSALRTPVSGRAAY